MALEQDIAMLRRAPLLAGFDAEALGLIAFSSRKHKLASGERLYEAGQPLDAAYFVLSGEIVLEGEGLAERRAGPGDVINELALFAPLDAPTAARASEAGLVMRVARETMTRVLEEFPALAAGARAEIARGLDELASRLKAAGVA